MGRAEYWACPSFSFATLLAVTLWRKSWAPGPATSNSPMCETSNRPAARRTARCSAMRPEYSTGMSQPQVCSTSRDRKSTRLNSSHTVISYAVFCFLKAILEKLGRAGTRGQAREREALFPPIVRSPTQLPVMQQYVQCDNGNSQPIDSSDCRCCQLP